MVSPGASSAANSSIVSSVASPAGTMSQTMRGAGSLATASSGVKAPSRPSAMIWRTFSSRAVAGHHAVAGAVQAARHVGAHAAEPDQDQVHRLDVPPCARLAGRGLVDARSRQGLAEGRLQLREPGIDVVAEVDADGRQVVGAEGLEVAQRLGSHERPEGLLAARDGHVRRRRPRSAG